MKQYKLRISTPSGDKYYGEAVRLSVRGTEGSLGILSGHIPLVTIIKPSECHFILPSGDKREFSCGSGILLVERDKVTVLSSDISMKK